MVRAVFAMPARRQGLGLRVATGTGGTDINPWGRGRDSTARRLSSARSIVREQLVGWGGRSVMVLRARWAERLPLPCWRCGVMIELGEDFDLEHDPPRSQGGTQVVGVSHPGCNRGHGARLGNLIRSIRHRLGDVDRSW